MTKNAELHCIGIQLVKDSSLGLKLYKRQKTSANDKGEFENCAVKAEKLYGYPEKTVRV
jgi:hypothetical protein